MVSTVESSSAISDEVAELNTRLCIIERCFNYDKFLGVDIRCLKKNPMYYNDTFNMLYEMTIDELLWYEHKVEDLVSQYGSYLDNSNGE